jgi:endoglycosylceramidase
MHDAWGMNAVRFLVSWAAIEPSAGQWDDGYLDKVAERIGWAKHAGLLVVLDMHQSVYGEGFASGGGAGAPKWTCDAAAYASFKPNAEWYLNNLSKEVTSCYDHFWSSDDLARDYAEAWRRLAARVVSYDNVIGFDVMNEPYWGSTPIPDFEEEKVAPLYARVVGAVREVAPDLVAFLEPSGFRNLGGATRLTAFPFPNVVYAPHSYDRDAEQGKGFDPSHRDALIQNLAALGGEAKALGAALWIGEYGGRAEAPGIAPYMTAQYDGTGALAAGSMYWEYDEGDGYGLLASDGTEKAMLVDAIVRPYPERIAGDPVSFAFDAASNTFTFTFHPNTHIAAPTILAVPDRVYPKGYSFDCGGCTADKSPGALTITRPPSGDPATVTLHP